ncbi:ATP-binding/permease protein CydD [Roseibium album]|nr:ATP-binding/permease protein CydD [Roseibium album]
MTKTDLKDRNLLGGAARAVADRLPRIGQPTATEQSTLHRSGVLYAISDLLWVGQAGLIAFAVSVLPEISTSSLQHETAWEKLLFPALLAAFGVIAIALLRVGLQHRALNLARRIARSIQSRAREDLLRASALCSPASEFPSSGAFASHVSEQVDKLGPYYGSFALQSVRVRLVPVGIVVVTAWFSWLAALILLISGPLIPVFMALIGMRAKAASANQQEELTRLSGVLMDRIKGLETLRLFGALGRTKNDIRDAGEAFRTSTMQVLKIAFLSSTVLELFSALGIAFCAVYVGFSLLGDITIGTWGAPLSFAGGLFVLLLAPEFFAPLRAYAAAYHDRAAGLAAQEKLSELMGEIQLASETAETVEKPKNDEPTGFAIAPAISFRKISLNLCGQQVFKNFSLSVEPGEIVLLSGPSGCGKTTLLDCVLGFHAPQEGEISIGEYPARQVAFHLRQNIMWLGQEPRLFHGSVKANLLKGLPQGYQATDEKLWKALQLAGAAELVRRLPKGLATPLGEDGFGLSVGEIRRIALARAAMRQGAKILLVDEPTAGLDEETAADVIKGLVALSKGRTTMIATHDSAVLAIKGRKVELATLRPHVLAEAMA